jgi:hypothetical protein
MIKNVGGIDFYIRIIAAVVIAILGILYQSWWGLIAIIPLATALVGFCPLWTLFGINTCKVKQD